MQDVRGEGGVDVDDDRVGFCPCGGDVYRVRVHRGRGACDAYPYGEDDEYALKCDTCRLELDDGDVVKGE